MEETFIKEPDMITDVSKEVEIKRKISVGFILTDSKPMKKSNARPRQEENMENNGVDNDNDGELHNASNIKNSVLVVQCQMRKRLVIIKVNAHKKERAIQNAALTIQSQIRRFLVTSKGIRHEGIPKKAADETSTTLKDGQECDPISNSTEIKILCMVQGRLKAPKASESKESKETQPAKRNAHRKHRARRVIKKDSRCWLLVEEQS